MSVINDYCYYFRLNYCEWHKQLFNYSDDVDAFDYYQNVHFFQPLMEALQYLELQSKKVVNRILGAEAWKRYMRRL